MNKKFLLCVVGPTAIGKTSLAIRLAQHFETEIISADSRQFYKEMQIGTAVPTSVELAAVPHHFIQNISVKDHFSVGDFEREALKKSEDLFSSHQVVVLVGGSGLYIKALTEGLDYFPEVDPEIRKKLNQQYKDQGIQVLQEKLKTLDPEYFSEADLENPHRLIRALEICEGTGKPYSSFRTGKEKNRNFESVFIGLTADRKKIYDRINLRVDKMFAEGLIEEAKRLYPVKDLNPLKTVGYSELFDHFEDQATLEEARSEIKKNTRRFAKRQLTWFRKNEKINWFDISTPPEEIISFLKQKMLSHS